MTKDKAISKGRKEADEVRDQLLRGLSIAVEAENKFPHTDAATISTLTQLNELIDKYGGSKTARLSYSKETAQIDNLTSGLNAIDVATIADTGLPRWFSLLEGSNTNFKELALTINELKSSSVDAASTVYPQLEEAMNTLFAMTYSAVRFVKTAELETAYARLCELIQEYK